MIVQFLCLAVAASVVLNFFMASLLRTAQKDLREVATEAILSSKATSAEDLAVAQVQVHQAAEDRRNPAPHLQETGPVPYERNVTLPDGRVVEVLRPL